MNFLLPNDLVRETQPFTMPLPFTSCDATGCLAVPGTAGVVPAACVAKGQDILETPSIVIIGRFRPVWPAIVRRSGLCISAVGMSLAST
jgi:hypothetical protein